MKFEISRNQAVDFLRADHYRDWSISAAEGIVDWLETQERFESVGGSEDRAPSLESIRNEWAEYDDGWDWLAQHTGHKWVNRVSADKSMLAHIGIDPDGLGMDGLGDCELEAMILSHIRGKFEMFVTRHSIVVREVAF